MLKRVKRIARDNATSLSAVGLILGIFLLIISIIGLGFILDFMSHYDIPVITGFLDRIEWWVAWLLIISLILLGAAAYFLYANVRDKNRFNELIDTGSKSIFVRNQNELEEIAFRLGTKYQELLFEKKKELKVK
jgi:hypothetical protein